MDEIKDLIKQGFEKADCRKPYTNEPYPYFDSQINNIAESLYNAGYGNVEEYRAEVERLKKENMSLEKMCELSKAFHDEKCAEFNSACYAIEKLQAENYQLRNMVRDTNTAVKEFAEKVKEKCHNYYPSIDHYCCSEKAVNVKDIDELLKEYEK